MSKVTNIPSEIREFFKENRRENVPGEAQYRNFIRHVGETELVPAVDIEDVTFSEEMTPTLKELCRLLEEHYGVKPIIYADLEVYMRCYSYHKDYRWWIGVRYENLAFFKLFSTVWQYSETIPVSGIQDHVDRNYAELETLLIPELRKRSQNLQSKQLEDKPFRQRILIPLSTKYKIIINY